MRESATVVTMTHIAFLRAVNLGKRRVNMPRLAELVRDLGFDDVWTHINSGNVVFEATGARASIERTLESALERDLAFEVTTFVRTATELRRVLARGPFRVAPSDTYFVTFLKDAPAKSQAQALKALSNDFDTLVVEGRDVHWRMHGRSTDTRLPAKAWDGIVGRHRSTSRNVNMLRKLMAKIDAGR
jgi:uncharacterized protein (DUF1697 family)